MSKAPSTILSDALASFNRAATLAFTAAQDQARKDITQAATDAREAVSALHASRIEEQAWKEEAGVWKAAASQAELTISHHLETIAQLRQEATQWKNQCLRLEETSRQEAVSWKEQFLRVEQERSKLAQRVEELVAEQLSSGGHAQTSATPYTPRYSAMGDLSAPTRLQRVSALDSFCPSFQTHVQSKSTPSTSKSTSSANRSKPGFVSQLPTPLSENQRSARQRAAHETAAQQGSTSNGTRQIVVRRVHAVVEVPVKEESVDRDDLESGAHISNVPSASISAHTSTSEPNRPAEPCKVTSRAKRKASVKRTYVEIDDEESEQDGASHRSKRSDTEEYQPVSDGDDELLMGVETNRKDVYGMKRVGKPVSFQKTARPPVVPKKRKAPQPTKKSRPSAASKS